MLAPEMQQSRCRVAFGGSCSLSSAHMPYKAINWFHSECGCGKPGIREVESPDLNALVNEFAVLSYYCNATTPLPHSRLHGWGCGHGPRCRPLGSALPSHTASEHARYALRRHWIRISAVEPVRPGERRRRAHCAEMRWRGDWACGWQGLLCTALAAPHWLPASISSSSR